MPILYRKDIDATTKLGIWKIEETAQFFLQQVPYPSGVTHPYKLLQHLAGRYLLQHLFPDFPYHEILIADTRKPYLPQEQFHFSISHSGNYAAAIVSRQKRAGVDIEWYAPKTERVKSKFLTETELAIINNLIVLPAVDAQWSSPYTGFTLGWCCKEAVYKYWGAGGINFKKHICIQHINTTKEQITVFFTKQNVHLTVSYMLFEQLCLAWTTSA